MTDRLTDDDLRAIRARVEAWRKNQSLWGPVETELTRDIMVNLDIPALLAHADALAAENDALREDHSRLQVVLWTLLNELSPGVVEELRAVWGNTNTRILEDRIEDARRALDDAP